MILALDQVAPNVQAVVLQTGGKGYGLEYPDEVDIRPPLREDMARIPSPLCDEVFYYAQYDTLKAMSSSRQWTFAEVRPDGIVGFLPGASSPMNMAQGIALYLVVWRAVYGEGSEVPYPGSQKAYATKHSDTFQDTLSQMEIFVALNDKVRDDGAVFNVATGDEPITWAEKWPGVCAKLGLIGVAPRSDGQQQTMQEFVLSHRSAWEDVCDKYGLRKDSIDVQGWGHTQFMLADFDFDRQYDVSKACAAGFTESIDATIAYGITFERMAGTHIIPVQFLK